jgi:hypothetical protein
MGGGIMALKILKASTGRMHNGDILSHSPIKKKALPFLTGLKVF